MQAVQQALYNPYWDEVVPLFEATHRYDFLHRERSSFCRRYSWAIPDPATLDMVFQWLGPKAVEMGAGTGYWASLLSQIGPLDLLTFDQWPPNQQGNPWFATDPENPETPPIFYPVQVGTPEILSAYADRVLFLCWPPYDEDMAYQSLLSYSGQRLIFIGEDSGGCTGCAAFFQLLDEAWHLVAEHVPVQWDGIHDRVYVYERGGGCDERCIVSRSEPLKRSSSGDFLSSFLRSFEHLFSFEQGITTLQARSTSREAFMELRVRLIACSQSYTPPELRKWLKRVNPVMARKYSRTSPAPSDASPGSSAGPGTVFLDRCILKMSFPQTPVDQHSKKGTHLPREMCTLLFFYYALLLLDSLT